MATKGRADANVKQKYWGTKQESKTEVGLVDLSVSDVEILEEGRGLGGVNIETHKGYKDKQARRQKGMLFKKKSLGNENDGEKLSLRSGAKGWDIDDGVWGRSREGAHIDPEKMFKSRRKKNSESKELRSGVDKCSVEKKSIPPETRRRRRGGSSFFTIRKRKRDAEDSGYTSKLESNEEENMAHQEDVAVVDLCCTSDSSYEASSDLKQGSSSVEMVGEVRQLFFYPLPTGLPKHLQVFKPGACGFGDVNFGPPGH